MNYNAAISNIQEIVCQLNENAKFDTHFSNII